MARGAAVAFLALLSLSALAAEKCSEKARGAVEQVLHKNEACALDACAGLTVSLKPSRGAEGPEFTEELATDASEAQGEVEGELEISAVDRTIALMLLGGIIFVFSLFNIVNLQDEDMVYYSWRMISSTISIFVAVMTFQCFQMLMYRIFGLTSKQGRALGDFLLMCVLYVAMQIIVASESGMLSSTLFDATMTRMVKGKPVPVTLGEQDECRHMRMKCSGILLSHMTGFAAISFGGSVQQEFWVSPADFEDSPPHWGLTLLVAVVGFASQIAVACGVRALRLQRISLRRSEHEQHRVMRVTSRLEDPPALQNDTAAARSHSEVAEVKRLSLLCAKEWDEHISECEVDVTALSTSFLVVQGCRYAISGVLPNTMGVEDEDWHHDLGCTVHLMMLAGAFAAGTMVLAWVGEMPKVAERYERLVEHMSAALEGSVAMCFAWCLLYSSKWQLVRILPESGNPNAASSLIVQCFSMSVGSFALILVLDKLADMDWTGERVDKAILRIITALGFLVGFSWEQAFHGGVETLSESTRYPLAMSLTMTGLVCMVVVWPWRRTILRQVIRLEEGRVQPEMKARTRSEGPAPRHGEAAGNNGTYQPVKILAEEEAPSAATLALSWDAREEPSPVRTLTTSSRDACDAEAPSAATLALSRDAREEPPPVTMLTTSSRDACDAKGSAGAVRSEPQPVATLITSSRDAFDAKASAGAVRSEPLPVATLTTPFRDACDAQASAGAVRSEPLPVATLTTSSRDACDAKASAGAVRSEPLPVATLTTSSRDACDAKASAGAAHSEPKPKHLDIEV